MAGTLTRPTVVPEWTLTGTRTNPGGSKINTGWVLSEKPPAEFFNWIDGYTGDWLAWIDERFFDGASVTELELDPGTLIRSKTTFEIDTGSATLFEAKELGTRRSILINRGDQSWNLKDVGDVERGQVFWGTQTGLPGLTFKGDISPDQSDLALIAGGGFVFHAHAIAGVGDELMRLSPSEVQINKDLNDIDFRVDGILANLIHASALANQVGFGIEIPDTPAEFFSRVVIDGGITFAETVQTVLRTLGTSIRLQLDDDGDFPSSNLQFAVTEGAGSAIGTFVRNASGDRIVRASEFTELGFPSVDAPGNNYLVDIGHGNGLPVRAQGIVECQGLFSDFSGGNNTIPQSQAHLTGRHQFNCVLAWAAANSAGGLASATAHFNVVSVTRTGPGAYDIVLDQGCDQNSHVSVSAATVANDRAGSYAWTSATTFSILIVDTSSGAAVDTDFSFAIIGRPSVLQ